jgi:hypothetical protein
MKTRFALTIVFSSLVFALGAHGQSNNPTVVSAPVSPPISMAPTVTPATAVTPNQIVYAQRLPSAAELTNAAAAQGLAIDRIEQTSTQVTAVYRYGNGQINAVAYLLLPAAGAAAASPIATPTTPPPAVVYQAAPRVVYYDDYYDYGPGYYPYYWYPPVAFRVGLGFNYHYGYHGGYGGFHGFHH